MKYLSSLGITKHQLLFVFLQAISGVAAILVGKSIAYFFDPEEYGTYFIATSLVSLYGAVIMSPVIQAYRHLFYRKTDSQLFIYFRSFLFWQAILLGFILLVIGVTGVVSVLILSLVFFQILLTSHSSLQMANINILGHITLQSVIQALSPFFNLGILLLFAFLAKITSYEGIWGSLVITEAIVVLLTIWFFKPHKKIELIPWRLILNGETLQLILRFSKPLLILPLFAWTVNNIDRYLIDYFYSKHEVGIYSAAYGLSSKVFLMAGGALITYLNASVYKQLSNTGNFKSMYKKTLQRLVVYISAGLLIVIVFYFFYNTIGHLLLSETYKDSFELLPILAMANLVFTAIFIPEQAVYALGKTKFILIHYVIGAIINIVLNLILMPPFGLWGAAWAMIISSFVQLSVLLFLLKRYMHKT